MPLKQADQEMFVGSGEVSSTQAEACAMQIFDVKNERSMLPRLNKRTGDTFFYNRRLPRW